MRGAAILLILLVLPFSTAQTPADPQLRVEAWLVGYDDGMSYAPLTTTESVAGTGITAPRTPTCPDPLAACGTSLVPSEQWVWMHLRVMRAGVPVPNATAWLLSAEGSTFLRTDEKGEARKLLRPIPAPGAAFEISATVSDRAIGDEWYGRFAWRGGAPVQDPTRETIFAPDDRWENLTLDVTEPGYFAIDIVFGMMDASAPRPAYAALASLVIGDEEGDFYALGTATAGGKEPMLMVHPPTQPPTGFQLEARDPIYFDGGNRLSFQGNLTPGELRLNLTLARAGLAGDDGWALRVFADPASYQVTPRESGPFTAAPITYQGVAARAVFFGPHVGTYTTTLNVTTPTPSVIFLGAATNPFTEGDLTLSHDRTRMRTYSEGIGGHGVSLTNMAQGDCTGRWTSKIRVAHGVASGYVGLSIAEGLTLPTWWRLDRAPLPCA